MIPLLFTCGQRTYEHDCLYNNESNDTLKKYEELWGKINDLISSISTNSDDYDKKRMKIKLNSDDDLPLKINARTS